MKKKQLVEQELVHVKILKASNIEPKVLSQVKAAIVCHNPYNSKVPFIEISIESLASTK